MLKQPNRLRKQKDFDFVYSQGRTVFGPAFNIRYLKTKSPSSRFAFVISNKTAKNATDRNKVKRRLRDVARTYINKVLPGYDIVINIKKAALGQTSQQLREALDNSLTKARLISSHGQNSNSPHKPVPKNSVARP